MYEKVFQLDSRPFISSPDVARFFPAPEVHRSLTQACSCVERSSGTVIIVGPTGVGKSLFLNVLAEQFKSAVQVANLACARLAHRQDLLQNILFELNLPYLNKSEGELRLSLIDYLKPSAECPNGVLLLVDEAHLLSAEILDEIRLLSNFVRDGRPRAQFVLAGCSKLEENLMEPSLASLNQRIAARCYLNYFSRSETSDFISHSVQLAGGNREIFSADAIEVIQELTDGCPRLINQVCDHAMILAATARIDSIDGRCIHEAWSDVQHLPNPWAQLESRMAAPTDSVKSSEGVIEFGEIESELGAAEDFSDHDFRELEQELQDSNTVGPEELEALNSDPNWTVIEFGVLESQEAEHLRTLPDDEVNVDAPKGVEYEFGPSAEDEDLQIDHLRTMDRIEHQLGQASVSASNDVVFEPTAESSQLDQEPEWDLVSASETASQPDSPESTIDEEYRLAPLEVDEELEVHVADQPIVQTEAHEFEPEFELSEASHEVNSSSSDFNADDPESRFNHLAEFLANAGAMKRLPGEANHETVAVRSDAETEFIDKEVDTPELSQSNELPPSASCDSDDTGDLGERGEFAVETDDSYRSSSDLASTDVNGNVSVPADAPEFRVLHRTSDDIPHTASNEGSRVDETSVAQTRSSGRTEVEEVVKTQLGSDPFSEIFEHEEVVRDPYTSYVAQQNNLSLEITREQLSVLDYVVEDEVREEDEPQIKDEVEDEVDQEVAEKVACQANVVDEPQVDIESESIECRGNEIDGLPCHQTDGDATESNDDESVCNANEAHIEEASVHAVESCKSVTSEQSCSQESDSTGLAGHDNFEESPSMSEAFEMEDESKLLETIQQQQDEIAAQIFQLKKDLADTGDVQSEAELGDAQNAHDPSSEPAPSGSVDEEVPIPLEYSLRQPHFDAAGVESQVNHDDDRDILVVTHGNQVKSKASEESESVNMDTPISKGRAIRMSYDQLFKQLRAAE